MLLLPKWCCLALMITLALVRSGSCLSCWFCDDTDGNCPKQRKTPNCNGPGSACWALSTKDDPGKFQVMLCAEKEFLEDTKAEVGECKMIDFEDLKGPYLNYKRQLLAFIAQQQAQQQQQQLQQQAQQNFQNFFNQQSVRDLELTEQVMDRLLASGNQTQGRSEIEPDTKYNVCACNTDYCKMDNELEKQRSSAIVKARSTSAFVFGSSVILLAHRMYGF